MVARVFVSCLYRKINLREKTYSGPYSHVQTIGKLSSVAPGEQ